MAVILPIQPHIENHGSIGGTYIKSIVFGGLDGIITTFSMVAAVAGASMSPEVVIMMGFANLLSDGLSMGLGDYLSESAEMEYILSEKKREMEEIKTMPQQELDEMVELYIKKGVSQEDATYILQRMMKYTDLFLEHMMIVELGLQVPDEGENPIKNGLVTFTSFVVFGSVPMWIYLATWAASYHNNQGVFGIACGFTAFTMFLLGATQARLTRQPILKTGTLMMLNGCFAAASAYFIGWGLDTAIGKGDECSS